MNRSNAAKDDRYWLNIARVMAMRSKDPSRKVGTVIVRNGIGVAHGANVFPEGVKQLPERYERPEKYDFTEHAERVAIYRAARSGTALAGGTIYIPWFPCVECARAIVLAGIKHAVTIEPNWDEEQYKFRKAETILREGGVEIVFEDEVNCNETVQA